MVDLGFEARKLSLRTWVSNLALKRGFEGDSELSELFAKCLVYMNVCIC